MKTTERYFLCKMILTLSLWMKSYSFQFECVVLSCGTVYYAVHGGTNFSTYGRNPYDVAIQTKPVCFYAFYKGVLEL